MWNSFITLGTLYLALLKESDWLFWWCSDFSPYLSLRFPGSLSWPSTGTWETTRVSSSGTSQGQCATRRWVRHCHCSGGSGWRWATLPMVGSGRLNLNSFRNSVPWCPGHPQSAKYPHWSGRLSWSVGKRNICIFLENSIGTQLGDVHYKADGNTLFDFFFRPSLWRKTMTHYICLLNPWFVNPGISLYGPYSNHPQITAKIQSKRQENSASSVWETSLRYLC